MTSQKRFRHQENSHSNNRNREIPPRFKRQKSSSGHISVEESPVSSVLPQSDHNNHNNNMTKLSQIPATTMSKESPSQTASSGRARYSVLQPVNYIYTEVTSNQAVPPQQLYQMVPSPQMWAPAGYTGLQPVMVSHNSMMLPQTVPQVTTYINENCAPSPSIYVAQCSPMSPWNTSVYGSPYPSSCSSPAPSIPSPGPSIVEANQEKSPLLQDRVGSAKNLDTKYTDPDLRTIEMLRELERVADKESQEAEDSGSDRKTLVSHHLRMLMCAMDRYTEDIDDEGDCRNDGAVSANSSGYSSPSTSPVPVLSKGQQSHLKGNKAEDVLAHAWNQKPIPQAQVQRPRPVLGNSTTVYQMPQRSQPSLSNNSFSGRLASNQVRHRTWAQDPQASQQSEWNLWSGPSFNFYGVLEHPLDSPNEHFENLQDVCFPASKERKPLYKR